MPILYIFISLTILVSAGSSVASPPLAVRPDQVPVPIAHFDDDNGRTVRSVVSTPDLSPRRDDIIGERSQAGDTWYDFHANGSTGKMIASEVEFGVTLLAVNPAVTAGWPACGVRTWVGQMLRLAVARVAAAKTCWSCRSSG